MTSKQTAAETRNLFETAGKKQTAKDFSPAPEKIETNFGDTGVRRRLISHR